MAEGVLEDKAAEGGAGPGRAWNAMLRSLDSICSGWELYSLGFLPAEKRQFVSKRPFWWQCGGVGRLEIEIVRRLLQ